MFPDNHLYPTDILPGAWRDILKSIGRMLILCPNYTPRISLGYSIFPKKISPGTPQDKNGYLGCHGSRLDWIYVRKWSILVSNWNQFGSHPTNPR